MYYAKVFLPACLVWDSDVEEPPQTPPFETLSWLTPDDVQQLLTSSIRTLVV